jgi:hypothetical protein
VLTVLAILLGFILVTAAMRAVDRVISRGSQSTHTVLLSDCLD